MFGRISRVGRSPLGVHFDRAKWTKTRLGRSPLRTSLWIRGWACVKSKFGPSLLLWLLVLPPHQVSLATGPTARRVPPPGLPWRSDVPAAVHRATDSWKQRLTKVRSWQEKYHLSEKQENPIEHQAIYVTQIKSRADRRTAPGTGHLLPGFHRGGPLGGSLMTFCPIRKSPQRSVPGGAQVSPRNWRTVDPSGLYGIPRDMIYYLRL